MENPDTAPSCTTEVDTGGTFWECSAHMKLNKNISDYYFFIVLLDVKSQSRFKAKVIEKLVKLLKGKLKVLKFSEFNVMDVYSGKVKNFM